MIFYKDQVNAIIFYLYIILKMEIKYPLQLFFKKSYIISGLKMAHKTLSERNWQCRYIKCESWQNRQIT